MKQGLQLRLSQQLAMTPQLQQAIRLLQLSTLELQQELQQALDSNPLLEQTDLHDEVETKEAEDRESLDTVDALEQKDMPEELPLDASWDEIYTAGTPSGNGVDYQDDELPVYQGETTQSLQDYLMWQVELTPFTDTDRAIATSIVDAVDDTGYLTVPVEDIVESIGDDEIGLEEVEAVLKRIQRFDPVGVAAKDLRDCLLVQLSQFAKETQEKRELETDYQGEVRELTLLYVQRGLEPELAQKVAEQLMVKVALDTHAREELGLTDTNSARPLQAAVFSALSFSAGATLPLVVAWLSPATLVFLFVILSSLFSLAALGYISSIVSRASPVRAIGRITFWSTLAMLSSMGIGHLAGQVLF